jgi:hypothetical protein
VPPDVHAQRFICAYGPGLGTRAAYLAAEGVVLGGEHVQCASERLCRVFVLVTFAAHVVELAAQACNLLAECSLAGRDAVLRPGLGVEAVRPVCLWVRTCRLRPASMARAVPRGRPGRRRRARAVEQSALLPRVGSSPWSARFAGPPWRRPEKTPPRRSQPADSTLG